MLLQNKDKNIGKVVPLKSRSAIEAGTVFSGTVVSFLFRKRRGGGGGDFLETPSRKGFPGTPSREHLPGKFPEKGPAPPRPQRQYAARVVVKRVFKGGGGDLRGGGRVVVDGLGNPNICVSRPRLGDAREVIQCNFLQLSHSFVT